MRQETENYQFSHLWDRMSLVKRNVITGEMRIMARLRRIWSRAFRHSPRRTWTFIPLQPAIIGATSTGDTQPVSRGEIGTGYPTY